MEQLQMAADTQVRYNWVTSGTEDLYLSIFIFKTFSVHGFSAREVWDLFASKFHNSGIWSGQFSMPRVFYAFGLAEPGWFFAGPELLGQRHHCHRHHHCNIIKLILLIIIIIPIIIIIGRPSQVFCRVRYSCWAVRANWLKSAPKWSRQAKHNSCAQI